VPEKQNLIGAVAGMDFYQRRNIDIFTIHKKHTMQNAPVSLDRIAMQRAAPGVNNAWSNLKRIRGSFYLDSVGLSPSNYRNDERSNNPNH